MSSMEWKLVVIRGDAFCHDQDIRQQGPMSGVWTDELS